MVKFDCLSRHCQLLDHTVTLYTINCVCYAGTVTLCIVNLLQRHHFMYYKPCATPPLYAQ